MMKECLTKNVLDLAKEAHNRYLANLSEDAPDEKRNPWEELSDDKKYSNIRQVESIEYKLASIGCYITDDPDATAISDFTKEERIELSKLEHELWLEEREESGWIYGPEDDDARKISKSMVPWAKLDKTTQGYDLNITDSIIPILQKKGIKVCRHATMEKETEHERFVIDGVPLILSVTGHTDIPDEAISRIRVSLDSLLSKLRLYVGDTEIILLTALAEGADRIVADWAISNGIKIVPILPMPKDVYKSTFSASGYASVEESKSDFERILNSKGVLKPYVLDSDRVNISRTYRDLSAYLVANSHLLIAVWDGRTYNARGGAYDTVRMAHSGIDQDLLSKMSPSSVSDSFISPDHIQHLNAAEDTLIYWIETERSNNSSSVLEEKLCADPDRVPGNCTGFIYRDDYQVKKESKPSLTEWIVNKITGAFKKKDYDIVRTPIDSGPLFSDLDYVFEDIPPAFSYSFGRLAWLDRDMHERNKKSEYDASSLNLYGKEEAFDEPAYKNCMKDMRRRFALVDSLSAELKKKRSTSSKTIALIQALMAVVFSLMIMFSDSPILNTLYFLLFALVSTAMWVHRKRKNHASYIEYRSLAESLRVQYYWGLIGINDSVSTNCYGYLMNGLSWMRIVLKGMCSCAVNDYHSTGSVTIGERIEFAEKYWINEKIAYLGTKEAHKLSLVRLYSEAGFTLQAITLILSISLASLTLVWHGDSLNTVITLPEWAVGGKVLFSETDISVAMLMKIIMIALAFAVSLVGALGDQTFANTPEQIKAKGLIYEMALEKLKEVRKSTDTHESRNERRMLNIMHEVGVQEINQNNDWVFQFIGGDIKDKMTGVNPGGNNNGAGSSGPLTSIDESG